MLVSYSYEVQFAKIQMQLFYTHEVGDKATKNCRKYAYTVNMQD